ncbi:MAG: VCBS repeat-containing protein [Bacteroidota bacterium]
MKVVLYFFSAALVAIFVALISCQDQRQEHPAADEGRLLAQQYCSGCHILPEPDELNKQIWREEIMPKMGYMLGLRGLSPDELKSFNDDPRGKIEQKNSPYLIAKEPVISREQYDLISAYYIENAPEELDFENPFDDLPVADLFKPEVISLGLAHPATTMTSFLSPGKLMVGDYLTGQLMQLNDDFEITIRQNMQKAVLQFQEIDDGFWVTVFGDLMEGTDAPQGAMVKYFKDRSKAVEVPIRELKRPCDADFADLDGDGIDDLIISEFGKYTGGLSWWKKNGNEYEENILLNLPGAINTEILDWDNDGDLDIISLFGQSKEAIYLFVNDGKGNFSTEILQAFPATYGSTHLLVADYNEDGLVDILYCHGDNGDYVPLHKPYHGIRVFLNQGDKTISESQFIPVPGIYKALYLDIDQDQDQDLLTISFFPAENQPSFVIHENIGSGEYKASRISPDFASRWMTLDHMDYDQDGDEDLVLGGFHWQEDTYNEKIGVLYLENLTR